MRNGPLTAFSILLAAPLFAFNSGFLSLAWGVVANLALAAGLAGLHRCFAPSKSIDPRALLACLAAGVAIAVLGGQGHVFLATPDWWIRDAVFDDLLRAPWPVGYERDGILWRLRAPLGLYLAPAAAGKIVGFGMAWAIFVAQSAALTGLILHGVTQGQAGRGRWITLTIFVFFSGADLVPWTMSLLRGDNLGLFLEGWSDNPYLSHLTQIFWAPNHSIAGWSFVAAWLAWRDGRIDAAGLGAIFALTLFWSPLAGVGALPFLALAIGHHLLARQPIGANVVAAGLCALGALPSVIFMMADSGAVERHWLVADPGFFGRYLVFTAIEWAPCAIYVFWSLRARAAGAIQPTRRVDFALVTVSLALIPLYSVNFTNDFVMRASIPALALLSVMTARALVASIESGAPRRWIIPVLLAGALTPLVEIQRAVVFPVKPYHRCNLLDAWATGPWQAFPAAAYIAADAAFETVPGLFRAPGAPLHAGEPPCQAGTPATQAR